MSQRMQGKTAVVTGAGSGIGKEVALLLAAEGAKIAALDIVEKGIKDTVAEIEQAGGTARAYTVNVADSASVDQARDAVVTDFGEITTLANIAGVFDGNKNILETDEELWDRVIAIDLKSMFLMIKAFLPELQKTGNGSIVNFSSTSGIVAHSGGLAYTAAKHGVVGITKQVAADHGPEVRCNAVLPGAVLTNMTKDVFTGADEGLGNAFAGVAARRYAQPKEIANAVLFLCTDESSYMYGSSVVVDGGWTAV